MPKRKTQRNHPQTTPYGQVVRCGDAKCAKCYPAGKPKKTLKHGHKIVVNGVTWWYRVGAVWAVARSEDDLVRRIRLTTLTGLSVGDIERGQWKRWFAVTPQDVRAWLEKTDAKT